LKPLFYLNKFFYKYRVYLGFGILFIILSNVFAILLAPIVRTAIDAMIDNLKVYSMLSFSSINVFSKLSILALFFGGLILASAIIKGIFMYFMRQTIIVMSRYIEYDLKNEIFAHYQKLGSEFYGKNYTGDLMNRISEDVSQVRMYLGPAVMYTINMIFLFILVISVMISINPTITFFVLLPLPFLSISIYYVSDIINKRSTVLQVKLSQLTTYVQEAFSGIRIIKAFAAEKDFEHAFETQSNEYKHLYMRLVQVNALFFPLTMMLVGLSVIITVFLGGKQVIAGTFTYGNIAEYVIYVNMLTWPVASLGWVTSIIQRASASQQRINDFLMEAPEPTAGNAIHSFESELVFNEVTFQYPTGKKPAVNNVSFSIKKGSTIGIIGTTGSGKSTLASLLLRMNKPTSGSIHMDGLSIDAYNLNNYRSRWGYVPQDIFLFSDSIQENIIFGLSGTEDADLQHAIQESAEMADVWKDIEDFPKGLETILGERGITLSGGQKQRVAIARAIIRRPDILLFDDALSAVDTVTERSIKQNLAGLSGNQTTIMISHRVSTIEDADYILVMDEGNLIEQGSKADLLKQKGLFYAMVESQKSHESETTKLVN
jgi:ATP-binding cassette subfamily B multidrug efflux pump